MLLTSDQYRRGLVKWQGLSEATIIVGSQDGSISSTPMSDSSGSVPDILVIGGAHLEVRPTGADVIIPPFRVVCDRLVGDEIEAQGFDTDSGQLKLIGMIAPGDFDRLVVSVPYLEWEDGWVVRDDDVMVRLANRVLLERESDKRFVQHDDRHSTYSGTVSTHLLEGSFLEVIAPQAIGQHREVVFSLLGLLALVVGDVAVGDVVQLDRLSSKPTPVGIVTEYEVRFPQHTIPSAPNRTLRMPRPVREIDLQEFDRLLSCVLGNIALSEDVLLPLREHERATRTESEIDRYKAAVIGIDSLLTRRSKRLGFVSELADLLADPRVPESLTPLREHYPDDQIDRILSRVLDMNPSTKDRFGHVAKSIDLEDKVRGTFREVINSRGDVMHGNTGAIKEGLPTKAVELLATLLKAILRDSCEADT